MRSVIVLASLALLGCSRIDQLTDTGSLKLYANAPPSFIDAPAPQSYAADAPVHVVYDAGLCLSSSCNFDPIASCAVAVGGSRVVVTSHAQYGTHLDRRACTDDCGFLSAACMTPPLSAGTWTFVFGDVTREVTIPSETTAPIWIERRAR